MYYAYATLYKKYVKIYSPSWNSREYGQKAQTYFYEEYTNEKRI